MKEKYDIDRELKAWSWFKAPTGRLFNAAAAAFIRLLPKGFDRRRVAVRKFKAAGADCHLITPLGSENEVLPCIFYIHGGGFTLPAFFGHYWRQQQYALRCRVHVADIDYGLSPRHRYPHALKQCYAVWKLLNERSRELKIDTGRMIIAGDSAGGLLAGELCLTLRENDDTGPEGLLLIYPVADNRMNSESMRKYDDTPMWNARANRRMWEYYLQGQDYVSPLERAHLLDVHNVYVELAQYDCLHDEGLQLYRELEKRAQIAVLNDTRGTYHGYELSRKAAVTKDSLEKQLDFIMRVFYGKNYCRK